MLAKESTYLASAWEQLQVISQDEQKRMAYTARLKAQLEHNQMMFEAEERGMKKGIEKGTKQTQRFVIQTMLKSLPIDQIAALLELSVEEAQSILQND